MQKTNIRMCLTNISPLMQIDCHNAQNYIVNSLMNDTVDGWNPAPPGMDKPCKYWDELPTSTGAGFLPSTVGNPDLCFLHLIFQPLWPAPSTFFKRQVAAFVLAFLRLASFGLRWFGRKVTGWHPPNINWTMIQRILVDVKKNGATTFTSFQNQLRLRKCSCSTTPSNNPCNFLHVFF